MPIVPAMARIAFIVDEMFEDSEFREPFDRLRAAGHQCVVIGREKKELRGKRGEETVTPDLTIRDVTADEFDALVIPGGYSPDKLRMDVKMVGLTREMTIRGKPVGAICHAGWMLCEADVADGRTVTSWPSIRTDLLNAGARWIDREVVEDGNLVTSRKPEDIPAFCDAILRQLGGEIPDRIPSRAAVEAGGPQPPAAH